MPEPQPSLVHRAGRAVVVLAAAGSLTLAGAGVAGATTPTPGCTAQFGITTCVTRTVVAEEPVSGQFGFANNDGSRCFAQNVVYERTYRTTTTRYLGTPQRHKIRFSTTSQQTVQEPGPDIADAPCDDFFDNPGFVFVVGPE